MARSQVASRQLWPIFKIVLALAILTAISWQFWRDLHHEGLQNITVRWPWLLLSAGLYVVGQVFSGWYWYRLLWLFGQRPGLLPAMRAYYVSQLGKYLPGKAWALMMRGGLVAGPQVQLGAALVTTFYEVLTTMASGALLAAVVFTIEPPALLSGDWHPAWFGLALLALCGVPLLPGVFNRIVGRLARRFQNVQSLQLPPLRIITLVEGLATTSALWICFGLSLWALIQGLMPGDLPLTAQWWAKYTAIIALACVGGFVAIVVPGGLGVREWVLDRFLAPELAVGAAMGAQPVAVVIVLLLRLVWTAAELIMAAVFWTLAKR